MPLEISPLPYQGIQHPKNGKIAVIRDEDIDSIVKEINDQKIEAISLNCSSGWTREDVSFLSGLKSILTLAITTSRIKNLAALENMHSLEYLQLVCITSEKVDFTKLPQLKICYLYWWKEASSIFKCNWLKELYLDELKVKSVNELEGIKNLKLLEKLVICNSNIKSLSWLKSLKNLKELELINCRSLSDFSELSTLVNLKKLQIEGCSKLRDLTFLKFLPDLEWLDLSNNREITSISSLATANNLKILFMTGSTSIADGDLRYLADLPQLAILSFTGKKHYTHKLIKKWSWDDLNNPDTLLKLK